MRQIGDWYIRNFWSPRISQVVRCDMVWMENAASYRLIGTIGMDFDMQCLVFTAILCSHATRIEN